MDAAPRTPYFLPHAPIDWTLLAQAVSYYQSAGYTYVEAPWAVSPESVEITCPKPEYTAEVVGLGSLVGSAEQSLLHLDLAGHLDPQKTYCALTPCFRLGDNGDALHHPYFMKVELYTRMRINTDYTDLRIDAMAFFQALLSASENRRLKIIPTIEGCDLELNGIEIGSYGVREHHGHIWVYGTGIAEPRFSQARASAPKT
jgi:hypothetical protein